LGVLLLVGVVADALGIADALSRGMPAFKSHEDTDAWRLATELKEWVFRIIKRPSVAKHFRFCDDIGRSARSAPANIAEGFWRGRERPRENAKFVSYALGSLGETKNHLRDAVVEKYIEENEYNAIIALNVRALQVTEGWLTYLRSVHPSDDTDTKPEKK
jgi:four helix bundle protein